MSASFATPLPATLVPCASCGTVLQGAYCHSCGEKRLDRHDYALGHFLEHAVDTVTHFDLKVVKGIGSPGCCAARMEGTLG